METTQNKIAPLAGKGEVKKPHAHFNAIRLSMAMWRAAYCLELARQSHADAGHLWRQAGCCIALSFFRMIGGRGV